MRGLTDVERDLIIAASAPSCDDPGEAELTTLSQEAAYDGLASCGRVTLLDRENDDYYWKEYFVTDLGRLALRVCPVGEP